MAWSDREYDNWKLSSPYDNDNSPEIFESRKHKLFSCYEDKINEFDDKILEAEKDASKYELCADNLEEYIEYLQDNLQLHSDEYGAIEELESNYHDEKEYAAECKIEQMKDDKLTGDY